MLRSRCAEVVAALIAEVSHFGPFAFCFFFFLSLSPFLSSAHLLLFTEANYHVSTLPLICWYAMALINIWLNIVLPGAAPVKNNAAFVAKWSVKWRNNCYLEGKRCSDTAGWSEGCRRPGGESRNIWSARILVERGDVSSSCRCRNDHHCCCLENRLFERKWWKLKLFFL